MKNERVPQRKRLVKSRLPNTSLMATKAFISLFRAGARAKETLSSGREKERLQAFRSEMERVDRYKEAALKNVDLSPEAMFDEVDSVLWNVLPYEEYQRHQSWLGEQKVRLAQHRAAQNLYISHKDDQQNVVGVMEEYVQQYPNDPDAWVWLGIAQRNTGNLLEAIKAQQRAIELTEDKLPHALKQRTLADWLHELGQTEEAINLLHEGFVV